MSQTNYNEILCQAIDTIVNERINEVSFDKTIVCQIVDDSEKELGKYKVSYGSSTFYAYTEDTKLLKNSSVYVLVPNGDWNEQKQIVSKKTSNDQERIIRQDKFDSFINITNNVISYNIGPQHLTANNSNREKILLWSYNKNESDAILNDSGAEFSGYTRLGLTAEFQTWLNDFQVAVGDYGLELRVKSAEDSDANDYQYKYCFLNCANMVGNPYNFESYYTQKALFDIGDIKSIDSMELYFYQTSGSFLNKNGTVSPEVDSLINPNIFVKDISIAFGYDATSYTNDSLIIYSLDSSKYVYNGINPEDNHKQLQARWIHRFDNGRTKVVELNDNLDYELVWYKKQLGAPSDTPYSGVDWVRLSNQEVKKGAVQYLISDEAWQSYNEDGNQKRPGYNTSWLLPNVELAEESIKALIYYDNKQVYSNTLLFSNEKEVPNQTSINATRALSIRCEDESFGNYFIYDLGGKILNLTEGQKQREFKACFNDTKQMIIGDDNAPYLTEAESIEWIIPAKNTMIVVDGYDDDDINNEDNCYHIVRYGSSVDNWKIRCDQPYRIKNFYTQSYNNNIIKCIVKKDGIIYTTQKELSFGTAGTAGTDYTFVLDFQGTETALNRNKTNYLTIKARLYDYEGKEIFNFNKGRNIEWSWRGGKTPQRDGSDYFSLSVSDLDQTLATVELNQEAVDIQYGVVQATLTGWGDYPLTAYLPIPIRRSSNYRFSGPTEIIYNSFGYLDAYFQNPCIIYDTTNGFSSIEGVSWTIRGIGWESGKEDLNQKLAIYWPEVQKINSNFYIKPKNIYVEGYTDLCLIASKDGKNIWSQPIFITQQLYPSSIINDWNGELTIDKEKNAILAAKVAAGRKEEDNTFSGVMMGDWRGDDSSSATGEITKNTGIYGFYHGSASFGFRDNGTAFIGKPGMGRIEFDGSSGVIKSPNNTGMTIDLDNGKITAKNFELTAGDPETTDIIKITSDNSINETDGKYNYKPLKIGDKFSVAWDGTLSATDGSFSGSISGSSIIGSTIYVPNANDSKFSVDWDGKLTAKEAVIDGNITASSGTIGGWKINGSKLEHTGNNTIFLDGEAGIDGNQDIVINVNDKFTVSDKGDLTAKTGTFESEDGSIKMNGYLSLKINDSLNAILGRKDSFFGVDEQDEFPGIGMSISTANNSEGAATVSVVKATQRNAGMSYNVNSYVTCSEGLVSLAGGGGHLWAEDEYININNLRIIDINPYHGTYMFRIQNNNASSEPDKGSIFCGEQRFNYQGKDYDMTLLKMTNIRTLYMGCTDEMAAVELSRGNDIDWNLTINTPTQINSNITIGSGGKLTIDSSATVEGLYATLA